MKSDIFYNINTREESRKAPNKPDYLVFYWIINLTMCLIITSSRNIQNHNNLNYSGLFQSSLLNPDVIESIMTFAKNISFYKLLNSFKE